MAIQLRMARLVVVIASFSDDQVKPIAAPTSTRVTMRGQLVTLLLMKSLLVQATCEVSINIQALATWLLSDQH